MNGQQYIQNPRVSKGLLMKKLEIQDNNNGQDQGRNNGADNPLIPCYPSGHGS